jgi:hypothetical protein
MMGNLVPILCPIIGALLACADLSLLHLTIDRFGRSSIIATLGLIRMLCQAICLIALIKPFGPMGLISALIAWSLMRALLLRRASRGI